MLGSKKIEKKEIITAVLVFSFFVFTMVFNLMHSSLWADEWVEYNYSRKSITSGEMYTYVIKTFQPPLYNWIMHFWLRISSKVLWFRMFNLFIGFGSGLFLLLTLKKLTNKICAYTSVVALAMCYHWVYVTQECSEYAMMIFFLFEALYFFVISTEKFGYVRMALFILANVGAIYSQYGAVFVVLPLLLMFFCINVFTKNSTVVRRVVIILVYLTCLVAFAWPLYNNYMVKQMEHNEISEHTLSFGLDMLKDFPVALGQIVAYLLNLGTTGVGAWIGGVLSIILIAGTVLAFVKGKLNVTEKMIIICLWFTYVFFYILIKLQIYGMVHANESKGLFSRYDYFFIPILFVAIPMLIYKLSAVKLFGKKNYSLFVLAAVGVVCFMFSFVTLLGNWDKAKDEEYLAIWSEKEGWNDTTYLVGTADWGFNYYFKHSDDYKKDRMKNVKVATWYVNLDKLPEKFWVWRTNWDEWNYQIILDKAEELGYKITVIDDSGFVGQLAFCEK